MSRPLCVVFSDAFAYRSYIKTDGLGEDYFLKKIKPGIGYSSNLHYLLFDGKSPDQVGFFTDYSWVGAKTSKTSFIQKKCDEIETINNLCRYLRRLIIKKQDNIPFSEQSFFIPNGKYKFMQKDECLVFGVPVKKIYESETDDGFDRAMDCVKLSDDNIVVVLEELDHVGHDEGSLGPHYMDAANNIVGRSIELFKQFETRHPGALCILISDHGMSDVICNVDVLAGVKKAFGLPGKRYQIYNDSIYLRLWCEDVTLRKEIKAYLDKIDVMIEISPLEKEKYGVTDEGAGEFIYRLREGYSFDPNCFGVSLKGGCKGLHGYMESSDSASGIVVSNINICEDTIIDALDVYKTFYKYLHENAED